MAHICVGWCFGLELMGRQKVGLVAFRFNPQPVPHGHVVPSFSHMLEAGGSQNCLHLDLPGQSVKWVNVHEVVPVQKRIFVGF